jgi:Arc-like DNA binding dprotein
MVKKPTGPAEVKVRMPKDLHRKIQRDADRHGQTINAEILRRLESSFQSDRMFEGILTPHNAKLIRMFGLAIVLAGNWKGDDKRIDSLQRALETIFVVYAGMPRPQRADPTRLKAGDSLLEAAISGDAIAQVVLNNEAPHLAAKPDHQ